MYLIAEIGQAHEGSLGIAHSYIDALADTGVNAVKFQTHVANAESSDLEPFRVKFSFEDDTRIDYWRRMEFTPDQWRELKKHCEEVGLDFISSPFSNEAVEILESIDAKTYKIGSGEVSNFLLLEKIARTGKKIILSSGMSSFEEIQNAYDFLKPFSIEVAIMQCTTSYPTSPEQWGLNVIGELKSRFDCPIGFSDHSGDIYACLAATALGAELLEFHVVFDKRMFGPDATSSLTPDRIKDLVAGVKAIHTSKQNKIDKSDTGPFTELKGIFEKSLAVNKDLKVGSELQFEDLEGKKPAGQGISASEFRNIIGRKLKRDKSKWDFISEDDLI